jgi:hypothetical protein
MPKEASKPRKAKGKAEGKRKKGKGPRPHLISFNYANFSSRSQRTQAWLVRIHVFRE